MDYKKIIKSAPLITRERAQEVLNNSYREKMFFENGYGISIITDLSLSNLKNNSFNTFQIAVLKGTAEDYDLCYDTPITNDVIGGLTLQEAYEIANEVARLKENDRLS